MSLLRPVTIALVLALALAPCAFAAVPAAAETEINALLGFVEASGCDFYRNGSRYDGKRAAAHLRYKFEQLANRDRIASAEDFIREAASASSFSGQPYEVLCKGRAAMPSRQWLCTELRRYRTENAPREQRGASGKHGSDNDRRLSRPCES